MRTRRDNIEDIEQIRSRTGPSDWDNGITKLFLLSQQTRQPEDADHNAYLIVASVAAIQSYFRWEMRRLIDSGDQRYIDNCRLHDSFKISKDHLVAVHDRRVTIGELAAHSIRLHSMTAIISAMEELLGTGFIDLVKEARNSESRQQQGDAASAIITSIADTIKRVERTFELRHIICHEAHLDTVVDAEEVSNLCSSCYDFLRASHYGIAHFHDPNAPVTLSDRHSVASERLKALESSLSILEQRILSGLDGPEKESFERMQQSWRVYAQMEAEYNASLHMNGSRGALEEVIVLEQLYKIRIDDLADIGKPKGRRFR
jgi:hypothetical protein